MQNSLDTIQHWSQAGSINSKLFQLIKRSANQYYADIQCSYHEKDEVRREESAITIEDEMSISIHCPRFGHAMIQMLCKESQVEHWCKQLLQAWEGATVASSDISLQYLDAWSD